MTGQKPDHFQDNTAQFRWCNCAVMNCAVSS